MQASVRSQDYRLDHEGRLFHMASDPGQSADVGAEHPEIARSLEEAGSLWALDALSEAAEEDERPFTVGHPEFVHTQLPARDAVASGQIQRSNRYPNDSYHTNWTSLEDAIMWEVEVLSDGDYEVEIYYTCPEGSEGSMVELSLGASTLKGRVSPSHDPPLKGMERDRSTRIEWGLYG